MTTKLNKHTIDLSQLVLRLAKLGLDEGEIAFCLAMTKDKFDELKEKHPQISKAFTKGLETRARKVEDALFRRATGFEYEEIKPPPKRKTKAEDKDSKLPPYGGNEGGVSGIKGGIKTVIPDVTAIVFWLKNMMPSKWGDEKETSSGKKQFIEALELYAKTNEKEQIETQKT